MTRKWRLILLVSLIGNLTIAYVGFKAVSYRDHINYWLEKYRGVEAEFSATGVFREANLPLQSDTIVPGRIVLFGTQTISHWPEDDSLAGLEVIDRGVDGQRAAGLLLRFQQDVVDLGPQFVLIEVSSYNFRPAVSADRVFSHVVSMIDLARCHGIEPIVTTSFPPRAGYVVEEHPGYQLKDTLAWYNGRLRDLAADRDLRLVDWQAALVDADGALRDDLSLTGVDLNDRGYGILAAAVRDALSTRLRLD